MQNNTQNRDTFYDIGIVASKFFYYHIPLTFLYYCFRLQCTPPLPPQIQESSEWQQCLSNLPSFFSKILIPIAAKATTSIKIVMNNSIQNILEQRFISQLSDNSFSCLSEQEYIYHSTSPHYRGFYFHQLFLYLQKRHCLATFCELHPWK